MTAYNETAAALQSAADQTGVSSLLSALPPTADEAFQALGLDPMDAQSWLSLSPSSAFQLLRDMFQTQWQTPVRVCLQLCGVLLLTAVCSALLQGRGRAETPLALLGGGMQLVLLTQGISGMLQDAAGAMAACGSFEKLCLPVLAALLTISGRPTAALSLQGAAFAAAQALEAFATETVVPMAAALAVLSAVGALLQEQRIAQLAEEARKLLLRLFVAAVGLFSGFLSLKAVIASSVDGLTMRGVKLAGSFVPIIGSAVGEAYSAAIGACALLKNTAGMLLIAVLLILCIPVALRIIAWTAALRIAGWFGLLIGAEGKALPQVMAELLNTWLAVLVLSCLLCIVTAGLTVAIGGVG